MLFLFGFILGMGGLALLIKGEAPWLKGQKVPARTSRLVGGIPVCFFPVAILTRYLVSEFEDDYDINVTIIYWLVAILWVALAGVVLYRGLPETGRKPARRSPLAAAENLSFKTSEPPPNTYEPPTPSRKQAKPQPQAQPKNPFDFG